MSYGRQRKASPTIRQGLSALRFSVDPNPHANAVGRRLSKNFGELCNVRSFGATDRADVIQANVRLCHTAETRKRFQSPRIDERRTDLGFVISEVLRTVPGLRDEVKITLLGARPEKIAGFRMCVAAFVDTESQKRLQAEREQTLLAMEAATGVRRTSWEEVPFELYLATAALETPHRTLQSMANLIISECPIELTLGPAQFEPDPFSA